MPGVPYGFAGMNVDGDTAGHRGIEALHTQGQMFQLLGGHGHGVATAENYFAQGMAVRRFFSRVEDGINFPPGNDAGSNIPIFQIAVAA